MGQTDIRVTPIGLGTWQFSKQKNMAGKFWPTLEDNLVDRIVSLSIAGGINWLTRLKFMAGVSLKKPLPGP